MYVYRYGVYVILNTIKTTRYRKVNTKELQNWIYDACGDKARKNDCRRSKAGAERTTKVPMGSVISTSDNFLKGVF